MHRLRITTSLSDVPLADLDGSFQELEGALAVTGKARESYVVEITFATTDSAVPALKYTTAKAVLTD